jgi:starch synthase
VKGTGPHVVMVAAECRDLAKVGGLGDVVRDLSKALRALGVPVSVVMPCYDAVQHPARAMDAFTVRFGGRNDWPVQAFKRELDGVPVYLLRSEEFFGGEYGSVYVDSERLGRGPFEDDAQRFAFFSTVALAFIQKHPELELNALHCHDWHTGAMLVLLKHDPRYRPLASQLQTLFTIHNLDYQGTRPFELSGERKFAAFGQWFPELYQNLKAQHLLEPLADPHASTPCFNPMRAGINLADGVSTVSPTYAVEITQPDDPARNFIGGRGLEADLRRRGNTLHGILNGLDYDVNDPANLNPSYGVNLGDWPSTRDEHKRKLLEGLDTQLEAMALRLGKSFKNSDVVLSKLSAYRPAEWKERMLVVAVTRVVRQKMSILLETLDEAASVLQALLKRDIALIVFGTGELEDPLEELNRWRNGLFVCAFDPQFATQLYAGGDLFLMPSDFEPCGLSQMIAMRYGCLPLVSDVGGLHDTIQDTQTGFVYGGANRTAARQALLAALDRALDCYKNEKGKWREMQEQAMRARFEWTTSARKYVELYAQSQGALETP